MTRDASENGSPASRNLLIRNLAAYSSFNGIMEVVGLEQDTEDKRSESFRHIGSFHGASLILRKFCQISY